MAVSDFILVFSSILFVYWFRYTCLLILNTKTAQDFARQVAATNQLSFPDVQRHIDDGEGGRLVVGHLANA